MCRFVVTTSPPGPSNPFDDWRQCRRRCHRESIRKTGASRANVGPPGIWAYPRRRDPALGIAQENARQATRHFFGHLPEVHLALGARWKRHGQSVAVKVVELLQ